MVMPWNTLFFNLSTLLSIALWVIDFSWFPQISLVSFGRPWITTLLKSIKLIHIRQYFVITDFDPFFKLTNRFFSSNIHFIDLSISFSMIDFDRFVTPCWNRVKVFCTTQNRLLLRVEEHRTRHQNGMGKRETLSLIYDKCIDRKSVV